VTLEGADGLEMLFALVVISASLGLLFLGGWTFLERSLYKDQQDKDKAAKVASFFLFAERYSNLPHSSKPLLCGMGCFCPQMTGQHVTGSLLTGVCPLCQSPAAGPV